MSVINEDPFLAFIVWVVLPVSCLICVWLIAKLFNKVWPK